jgi:hypothetical protein
MGFEVRQATASDVPVLAELDRRAFAGLGMGYYGESHVRCWLEVNPEGLLVASRDGTPVACCYSQYVDFSPAAVSLLTTDAAFTDSALTRKTHRPDGNSIHVVTASSIAPGGRRALFEALLRQMSGTVAPVLPRSSLIGSRIPPVAIAARWWLFPSRAIASVNHR